MAQERTGNGGKKRYDPEVKKAVVEDALRTTIKAASESWGIPHGTVAYWYVRRGRKAEEEPRVQRGATTEASGRAAIQVPQNGHLRPHLPGHARRYSPAEVTKVLDYAAQHGYAATTRELGPCKATIVRWERRVRLAAVGRGDDPTCGPDPADIETQRDQEILEVWKHHPGLGPSQIKNQLRRKGIKTSVNTVRRVMEESGYRPPKVESRNHDRRYEALRPNQLWHFDFVQRFINRATTFTLIILDDYSRFVVGHGVSDAERGDVVIAAFEEAVQRHGKPETVMTDRGSAFWSWRGIGRFTTLLTELGIDQVAVEDKEVNGKVERFNANIAKELFDQHRFSSLSEMRRHLKSHLHFYNHSRTHHSLGGVLVPADRYYGRADEVMALVEAGAGREQGLDTLDLRHRCLELFKVTSTDGRPAVFLMGQQIL